jgi:hypothetical protein
MRGEKRLPPVANALEIELTGFGAPLPDLDLALGGSAGVQFWGWRRFAENQIAPMTGLEKINVCPGRTSRRRRAAHSVTTPTKFKLVKRARKRLMPKISSASHPPALLPV